MRSVLAILMSLGFSLLPHPFRNQTVNYRIRLSPNNAANIAAGNVPAVEFYSRMAPTGQNDGARCANAPVVDEDSNIDFGDAPDSCRTLLASNGPRHELDQPHG